MMNDIEIYTNLMVDGFKDDPGVKVQFEGIDNGLEILKLYFKCQIGTFSKLGLITTSKNGEGIVIGYTMNNSFMERLAQDSQGSADFLLKNISADDLMKLQQNMSEVLEIAQPDWYKKFIDKEEVYVLQIIVVNESFRGTGVFRKLISPIIESAKQNNMPVVLQTHKAVNVAKFEHFGFCLMETVVSDKINLSCYNLLKY
jgi:GNAT superfamily N-acetyltransferase